ncbi:MAG: 3-keto-5-aminohexanoate cleavage protein [Myxococcales bacterium]|nr:3-keto-5-aminohexanoate cleavage protein [Myxococcales bacterium]
MEPLIIECALNEQVTRSSTPHVPITTEEIVEDALAAAVAGASIIHFHARDPATGALLHPGTESYRETMRAIRRVDPDVILYPTYGSSPTPEERFSHLEALALDPEIRLDCATIDPGAVNYADYDPERNELGWDFVLSVSHAEARHFFELARRHGIRYSFTCREPGHVRHVLVYRRLGWVDDPLFVKVVLSEHHAWGMPPSEEAIRILTRGMIPEDVPYRWMVYVEGASHAPLARHAVERGGHVRTGVGDNPLFEGARLSNAEQVTRVVEMARAIGRSVAGPEETRRLLASKPAAARGTAGRT